MALECGGLPYCLTWSLGSFRPDAGVDWLPFVGMLVIGLMIVSGADYLNVPLGEK